MIASPQIFRTFPRAVDLSSPVMVCTVAVLVSAVVGGTNTVSIDAAGPLSTNVAYVIVHKVALRPHAPAGPSNTVVTGPSDETDKSPGLPFGQKVTVLQNTSEWIEVETTDRASRGWVHRTALTPSDGLIEQLRHNGAIPKTIVTISDIAGSTTYHVEVVAGGLPLPVNRSLRNDGICVAIDSALAARNNGGISVAPMGVTQLITPDSDWELYCYSSRHKALRSLVALAGTSKRGVAAFPRALEPSASDAPPGFANETRLPGYIGELTGHNPVRVMNPNDFTVAVGLRCNGRGKNFAVASHASTTVHVPDGHYEIYFQYSSDPDALYQGDNFTLKNNGVEIQIVKVVNGNYGIRKVR